MENKDFEDFSNIPSRTEEYGRRNRKNNHTRKLICTILLVILLIAFYGIGAYGLNILNNAKSAMSAVYSPSSDSKKVSKILKEKKPFSVLLLGTDTGDLGRTFKGRTDTIIVATVNPKTEKVTMTSIPRDTCVEIPGTDTDYDKINSAYTYGGVKLAVKTVEKTLDIPIDFYMLINMGGLTKIVDDLGGVTVTPPLTFSYENVSVTKGKKVTLNGAQALSYSRMRDDDPEGDYGRQKRQKQIITAIIKKAMSASSFTKYNKTLEGIKGSLKTDLSYNDIMMIESYYKDAGKHIKSYVLQGDDAMIGGLSYQVVPVSEKEKISNQIRGQLGLDKSTYDFEKDSPFATTTSDSTGYGYESDNGYGDDSYYGSDGTTDTTGTYNPNQSNDTDGDYSNGTAQTTTTNNAYGY